MDKAGRCAAELRCPFLWGSDRRYVILIHGPIPPNLSVRQSQESFVSFAMRLSVPQSYLPLVYLGVGGTVLDMVNGKGHALSIFLSI